MTFIKVKLIIGLVSHAFNDFFESLEIMERLLLEPVLFSVYKSISCTST